MAKLRVYELARELSVDSKTLVTRLKQMGVDVASHQSTLTEVDAAKARQELNGGAAPAAVAKQASGKKVVVRRRKRASEAEAEEAKEATKESEDTKEAAAAPVAEEAAESTEAAAVSSTEEAQKPEAESEPLAAEAASEEKATPAPRKTVRPRSEGGAKIVRRASPEEIAATKKSKSTPPPQRKFSKPAPKPTTSTGAPTFDPSLAPPSEDEQRARRVFKDKKSGDEPLTEEEKAKKITAKQRRARSVSTRDLLEAVEIEDDPIDTEAAGAAEVRRPAPNRGKTVYTPSSPMKRRDLKRRRDLKKTQITTPRASYRVVKMGDEITVNELSKQMSVKAAEVIKKLMGMGVMATINSNIDLDTATLIVNDFGFELKNVSVSLQDIVGLKPEVIEAAKKSGRPPVVTVMGHVDHGKTSILDAIRNSKVASGEAGGITQHIGAYSIEKAGKKITFIDTPGHEAFSSMRARGANCTDIVILVVAADDGVMPQTVEAISHAQAAEAPIIVALNKMDKQNINIDRVFTELAEHGIQSEEWGGETQFVKCSALNGTGLDELIDAILLQSEILELQAAPTLPAEGVVVEAHLDTGRGPVATLLVQQGTLRQGDHVVVGTAVGRVRAMTNHLGSAQKSVGPSAAAEIIGLTTVPMAGDQFNAVKDEKTARDASDWRERNIRRKQSTKSSAKSLEDLLSQVNTEEHISVPVILKADTQGSVEAIVEALTKLDTDKVSNQVVHKAVGGISESDLSLAEATGAVVIGFNVRAQRGLDDYADKTGVVIKYFSIIYDVVDAVKNIMSGKLPPILKEVVTGHAEVRDAIRIPKIGVIAGSAVTDGKINRDSKARLVRDDVVIYEGKLGSLRRFKDNVAEVQQGYECGISLEGYTDVRVGDVIEAYIIEEHVATL
ncbi:translation initiation factor IF-2 [Oligoflexaceae bacterium]|nr:translation initiation factor IF-2 [Oligoflexaceae bacterium]